MKIIKNIVMNIVNNGEKIIKKNVLIIIMKDVAKKKIKVEE